MWRRDITVTFSWVCFGAVLKAPWPWWHTLGRLCPAPLLSTQQNKCGLPWVCVCLHRGCKCVSKEKVCTLDSTHTHKHKKSHTTCWQNVAYSYFLFYSLCFPSSCTPADSVGQTLVHTLCILSSNDTSSQTHVRTHTHKKTDLIPAL